MDVGLCEDVNFSPNLPKSVSASSSGPINVFQQPLMQMVNTIIAHYKQLQALEFKVQEILCSPKLCKYYTYINLFTIRGAPTTDYCRNAGINLMTTVYYLISQTQQECLKMTSVENKRFKEVHSSFDFNVMFMQISTYTKKVVNIHNDMVIIQNKMDRLKHRAKILKEYQDVKVREIQEAKALHEERERLLTAKPVWETNQLFICDQT